MHPIHKLRNSRMIVGVLSFWAFAMAQAQYPSSTIISPSPQQPAATQSPAPGDESDDAYLSPEERVNIAVYEACHGSVVHIESQAVDVDRFFGIEVPVEGSGSGAIWDHQGHILTNYHVVEDGQRFIVTLDDGSQHPATLVGKDPPNDIALLKIDAPPQTLHPVRPGRSDSLRVGQKVFAFGSPFGLERTMTAGIVSSLNRTLPGRNHRIMKSIIQIDAALNRGNSGGPLMDSRGRLVGMNTAIASSTGESAGVGFAIPASTILRIVPQLIQHGRVERPLVGIDKVAETNRGLLVVEILPDGPADAAGLRRAQMVRQRTLFGIQTYMRLDTADIITHADGKPVRTIDDLMSIVEQHRPGDLLTLTILREGNSQQLALRLGEGG